MTDFGELVKSINGNGAEPRLTREQQLEILAAMTKPASNIRWTQKDLDETLQHVFGHLDKTMKTLLPSIGKFVADQIKPLRERIDELEREVELLKAGGIKYCGVWQPGTYHQGMLVTCGGSIWHCNRETVSRPGDPNSDWQLAVKRGKDGKAAA